MIKKYLVFLLLTQDSLFFGMQDLAFRQRVDEICEPYALAPEWDELHLDRSLNMQLLSGLSFNEPSVAWHETAFLDIDLHPEMSGDRVEPRVSAFEGLEHDGDRDTLRDTSSVSSYQLSHSPILDSSKVSFDSLPGWMHRDSTVFPFFSNPDMSNDHEIKNIQECFSRKDVASLAHALDTQKAELQNTSFIDRTNRFKISRRLSFIAKAIRQNAAMYYLLSIYKTYRLDIACVALDRLVGVLQRGSIIIDGKEQELTDEKFTEIIAIARRLIEQRKDYQTEIRKYSVPGKGGQLADRGSILNRIDLILAKAFSNKSEDSSRLKKVANEGIDSFTEFLLKKVYIHYTVDPQIVVALSDLQKEYSYFENYLDAVLEKLKEFHAHGLLTPGKTTLEHGVEHFFKSLVPNNPLENPKEFSINVIKYTALGTIHTWTGGALLPLQGAMQIAFKISELNSQDISKMTPKQYAEFVAEQLVDLSYTIFTTKAIQKAKDAKIPEGFVRITRDIFKGNDVKVAVAGGEQVPLSSLEEATILQTQSDKEIPGGSGKPLSTGSYTFKNGKYENASYHTPQGNNIKSPCPIDGQHALDNSFKVRATTTRRIGISNQQFVVLDETSPGIFHGHVREWDELRDGMQAILRAAGLVTKKGKIKI